MTQKSRRYLLHEASYSQFCPKYRCHGNGGRSGKNAIGSIRWPIPEKPPTGAKILQKISYASRVIAHFVPNFVAMATGVGRGKCNWQHSMANFRKPPYRRKNLAKISYASRVIAHFVPNFVAMATRGRGRERGRKMGKRKGKENGKGKRERRRKRRRRRGMERKMG